MKSIVQNNLFNKLKKFFSFGVLKNSLKWVLPFMMISFVMLIESWVFESLRGEWGTVMSKTLTFSGFNVGFFLGMTLAFSIVISRHRHRLIHRESRLYGFSIFITLIYIIIVFPGLFVDSQGALEFLSGKNIAFKSYEIEYFQMYAVSWIIELTTITWFLIMVVRGDWKGVAVSRGLAVVVKIVVYLILIFGVSNFKDERLLLTMAYSSIALRVAEYMCYFIWVFVMHRNATTELHNFWLIPLRDFKRLGKRSLLLINPWIYNFILFFAWRFVFDLSSDFAQILAIILPLYKMILYGSSGLSHSIPHLIMEKVAMGKFEEGYSRAFALKRDVWFISIFIGIIMYIPILILTVTHTFKGDHIDVAFYENSLLIIGSFYCLLAPIIIQTDVLSTIMLSGGRTRSHTFLNIILPLLSVIILGFMDIYSHGFQTIWWVLILIIIVNLKSVIGIFYDLWKFNGRKWLRKVK